MTSEIEVQVAMLRAAKLNPEDASGVALVLINDDNSDRYHLGVAKEVGLDRNKMQPDARHVAAAACLIIAAEYVRLSPFERWFRKKHTPAERDRFTERDKQMMQIGWTEYGTR